MEWLIKNIVPLRICHVRWTGPDPKVIEQGLKLNGDDVMINSISLEKNG